MFKVVSNPFMVKKTTKSSRAKVKFSLKFYLLKVLKAKTFQQSSLKFGKFSFGHFFETI